MSDIDFKEVAEKYNSLETIWDMADKWHYRTFRMIRRFVKKAISIQNIDKLQILNAGSAGYSYEIPERNIIHIDIADQKIAHIPNSIVASVEDIPLPKSSIDFIICVGSVLNYCDPVKVIQEFNRVLHLNGHIILEYENSNTLELLGTNNYNKKATLVDTFYRGDETIWFFSDQFINEILHSNGLEIIKKDKCHILSPLIYRWTKKETLSAMFGKLDFLFKWLPTCSNTILLIRRKS